MTKSGKTATTVSDPKKEKRRRLAEGSATFGLLLIAASLAVPFAVGLDKCMEWLTWLRWSYAAGALIFTAARVVAAGDHSESLRLRRLRRLEFWAGIAFCMAAFFWFYNFEKFHLDNPAMSIFVGPLRVLNETILFSLAGAVIQVIASWMIAYRQTKEQKSAQKK